jgi:hypothetical protein
MEGPRNCWKLDDFEGGEFVVWGIHYLSSNCTIAGLHVFGSEDAIVSGDGFAPQVKFLKGARQGLDKTQISRIVSSAGGEGEIVLRSRIGRNLNYSFFFEFFSIAENGQSVKVFTG